MGIKGKTVFELTDVNTGKVERYEDCNMITNGLQEFLDPCGSWGIYPFANDSVRNTSVMNTLTGGILLFDGTLDEDVTNTYANASLKMVGNGALGISNATSVTELGTYNSVESGVQADGSIKYVYDFLTSQANGTIQSVCLTSNVGGYMGYGNESQKRVGNEELKHAVYQNTVYKYFNFLGNSNNYYATCMMYAVYGEDAIYVVEPSSIQEYPTPVGELHWTKTGKIRINKYRLGVSSVGLTDYAYVNKLIESYDVAIPQDILNYMSTGSGSYYISHANPVADGNKGEIFIVFNKNAENCNNGSFVWIMKIDKDMQVTSYKVTNNTGYNIYGISRYPTSSPYNNFIIDNDYFWCCLQKNGSYNLVGIKYADSTQIIETDVYMGNDIALTKTFDHILEYGQSYVNDYHYRSRDIFNTVTKKSSAVNGYIENNSYSGYFKVLFADRKGLYLYCNNRKYFNLIKDPRYLATINNLSEPVVKTASKTMKITYILTPGVNA